jgi:hypothetical protein
MAKLSIQNQMMTPDFIPLSPEAHHNGRAYTTTALPVKGLIPVSLLIINLNDPNAMVEGNSVFLLSTALSISIWMPKPGFLISKAYCAPGKGLLEKVVTRPAPV